MKTIIREAKEINSLINAFAKKNPNISPKDLEQLFTADPTTVQNSRGVFAGKYCVWIGNFCSGYAKVKLNTKYNFIDTQGKLLSPN